MANLECENKMLLLKLHHVNKCLQASTVRLLRDQQLQRDHVQHSSPMVPSQVVPPATPSSLQPENHHLYPGQSHGIASQLPTAMRFLHTNMQPSCSQPNQPWSMLDEDDQKHKAWLAEALALDDVVAPICHRSRLDTDAWSHLDVPPTAAEPSPSSMHCSSMYQSSSLAVEDSNVDHGLLQ